MPSFPQNVRTFTPKLDLEDVVEAAHMNAVQAEITSLQQVLGVMPHGDADSIRERLEDDEQALEDHESGSDPHDQYLNASRHAALDLATHASPGQPSGRVPQADGSGGVTWVAPSAGVTDHGALDGLGDDDHPQYLNETRHNSLDHGGLATSGHTHNYVSKSGDTMTGSLAFNNSVETPLDLPLGYEVFFTSQHGPNGRMWLSGPDGGQLVLGPRVGSSRYDLVSIKVQDPTNLTADNHGVIFTANNPNVAYHHRQWPSVAHHGPSSTGGRMRSLSGTIAIPSWWNSYIVEVCATYTAHHLHANRSWHNGYVEFNNNKSEFASRGHEWDTPGYGKSVIVAKSTFQSSATGNRTYRVYMYWSTANTSHRTGPVHLSATAFRLS